MCGRFNLRTPLTVLAKQFQFELDGAFAGVKPRYNIAPTQQVLAVGSPLLAGAWQLEIVTE